MRLQTRSLVDRFIEAYGKIIMLASSLVLLSHVHLRALGMSKGIDSIVCIGVNKHGEGYFEIALLLTAIIALIYTEANKKFDLWKKEHSIAKAE